MLVVYLVVDETLEHEACDGRYDDFDTVVLEPLAYVLLTEAVVLDVDFANETNYLWFDAIGFDGVVLADCLFEEFEEFLFLELVDKLDGEVCVLLHEFFGGTFYFFADDHGSVHCSEALSEDDELDGQRECKFGVGFEGRLFVAVGFASVE